MNAKPRRALEWDELKLILALSRGRGLLGAAELLGVDPSTIHRRIHALEQRIGQALFERRRRQGWLPTPVGERLLATAERIEEEVAGAERSLERGDELIEGTVRLTTTDSLAQVVLMPMLAELRARHPALVIDLRVSNRLFVFGRGEAEIGVRGGSRPGERSVAVRKLVDLAGAIYAAPAYLDAHGRPRRRRDLAEHHFVTGDESMAHVIYTQHAEALRGASVPVMRCDSLLAQVAAAEAGIGVVVLPCFLGDRPSLVRLFGPEPNLREPMWLVVHEELRRVARVRVVADFLAERIAALAGPFAGIA